MIEKAIRKAWSKIDNVPNPSLKANEELMTADKLEKDNAER